MIGLPRTAAFMLLLFSASTARAQQDQTPLLPEFGLGALELGVFGQYTGFNHEGASSFHSRAALGPGARAGLFVTPDVSVELDAVGAKPQLDLNRVPTPAPSRNTNYSAVALRINYNFLPAVAERWSFIAGLGIVRTKFSTSGESSSASGVSGLLGARVAVWGPVVARFDGVLDYVPEMKSSGSPEAGRNVNVGFRAGVSFFFDLTGQGRRGRPTAHDTVAAPSPLPEPLVPGAPAVEPRRPGELDPTATAALLEPIFFDYESAGIRADAAAILDRKLPWLRANPHVHLRLEGHADDRGADEFNLALGQQRATSTLRWLADHGISPTRLQVLSYGEERRLCVQEPMTEPCHQQNRRVEFRIISTR